VARGVIDTLKGGALLFAYYPDSKWLSESTFFKCGTGGDQPRQVVASAVGAAPGHG
jgi:hypothetical protein